MSEVQYPEDEFDRIAKDLPQGAHRPGQPWWYGFLPFVIAIIVAPLLAWGLWLLIGSHSAPLPAPEVSATSGDSQAALPTSNISEEEELNQAEGEETSSSPSVSSSSTPAEESPSLMPDKSTPVMVLNASGINGLAAQVKGKIDAKGYTKVTADNFTGARPEQTTIYFDAAHKAEALELQRILGIDMLIEKDSAAGIQVVLRDRL